MHSTLLHGIILVFCLAGLHSISFPAETTSSEIKDEDILAFIDNPDLILGPGESTPETSIPGTEDSPLFVFSSSVSAGIGHSNNFLKKHEFLAASDYLQVELDAFGTWISESIEISALAFAEASFYDFNSESSTGTTDPNDLPSDEVLTFAQVKGNLSRNAFDFGMETSFLYASFIYDSSIPGIDASAGTQIRQTLPELKLYMDWYAPGSNRVSFGISASRAEFNLPNQDYWDPALNVGIEHVWSKFLTTTSEIDYSRQIYDDDYPKLPNGDPLVLDESLVVDRLAIIQRLVWKPQQVKWLRMDISAGMAWESEETGYYEAMRQSWINSRFTITNSWGVFKLSGKWGEYRYDNRQTGYSDPRLNLDSPLALQTNRSLTFEYSKSLAWGFEFVARNQWNSLSSRVYRDNYSERRTELLLGWNY